MEHPDAQSLSLRLPSPAGPHAVVEHRDARTVEEEIGLLRYPGQIGVLRDGPERIEPLLTATEDRGLPPETGPLLVGVPIRAVVRGADDVERIE